MLFIALLSPPRNIIDALSVIHIAAMKIFDVLRTGCHHDQTELSWYLGCDFVSRTGKRNREGKRAEGNNAVDSRVDYDRNAA